LPFRRRTWGDYIQFWLATVGIVGLTFAGLQGTVVLAQKPTWALLAWLGAIVALGSISVAVAFRRKQDVLGRLSITRVVKGTLVGLGILVVLSCPVYSVWLLFFTK
jgi:hypothetical protein